MDRQGDIFLGRGWRFPPAFDRQTKSADMVSGETDIRESIRILLSTRKGERVMLPEYGCDIWRFVHRTIDNALIGQVEYAVSQALLNWEPRITVENVTATPEPGGVGILLVEIGYIIRRTNARSNLVYPFYLAEGTTRLPER